MDCINAFEGFGFTVKIAHWNTESANVSAAISSTEAQL